MEEIFLMKTTVSLLATNDIEVNQKTMTYSVN